MVEESLGQRIKRLRESKGLTQTEVAEFCGVSREAVSQWEGDVTENIKLQPFLMLVRILGTTPEYLVWGPEPPDLPSEVDPKYPALRRRKSKSES